MTLDSVWDFSSNALETSRTFYGVLCHFKVFGSLLRAFWERRTGNFPKFEGSLPLIKKRPLVDSLQGKRCQFGRRSRITQCDRFSSFIAKLERDIRDMSINNQLACSF